MKFLPKRDIGREADHTAHDHTAHDHTAHDNTAHENAAREETDESRSPTGGWRPFSKKDRAPRGPWQHGNEAGVHAFLILMVLAMLAGPAALALHLLTPSRTAAEGNPTEAGGPASVDPGAETQATGTAESLVALWLKASRDDADRLNSMLVVPVDDRLLPKDRPKGSHSVIATDAHPKAAGEWVVTVQVDGRSTGPATYQVIVDADLSNPRALSLPALISDISPDARPIEMEQLRSDHPAVQAVDGFGRALLTGEADLERWLAPGSEITGVTPAPCTDLATAVTSTTAVPAKPEGRASTTVLATYTCVADEEVVRTTQYVLDLQGRDGRWEVLALGHRFAEPKDDTTQSPTAAPPSNPSSSPSGTR